MEFPKSARVRSRAEYLRFFKQSDVVRLGMCTLFKISNDQKGARLGITIKARVNSVYRNKLKRQIREAFRKYRGHLGNEDINVVVPGGLKVGFLVPRQIRSQLEGLWKE